MAYNKFNVPGTQVVIVGGGFGGVTAAKRLLRRGFSVTLIDQKDQFVFKSLLIEVASGVLKSSDIQIPFTKFLRSPRLKLIQGTVQKIDTKNNTVSIAAKKLTYDYLVLASGANSNQPPIPGIKYSLGFNGINDAITLKKRLLEISKTKKDIALAVIGGGATGVELAFCADKFLAELNPSGKNVISVFDTAPEILSGFNAKLRSQVVKLAKDRGIDLRLDTQISKIDEDKIFLTDKIILKFDIILRAAGVKASTEVISDKLKNNFSEIEVDETLAIKGLNKIFAVGDVVSINGHRSPKLAQVAVEQAKIAADNIKALHFGRRLKKFSYTQKWILLSLGRHCSICHYGLVINGRTGDLVRWIVLLVKIPTWNSKFVILKRMLKNLNNKILL